LIIILIAYIVNHIRSKNRRLNPAAPPALQAQAGMQFVARFLWWLI
jgi:hypothetical protein